MLLASNFFAAMPSSTSYQLNNYGFGSGGTSSSTSTTYGLNATTGEQTNNQSSSTTYTLRAGNNNTQQAYVPAAPTFSNTASYYNKLRFILTPGASPTDTKFSIAISSDNFATTNYIQLDDTIGPSKVYQTYAAWGGASGQLVLGLTTTTTYKLKANAIQGNYTETEYGPSATASTVATSISFDIDVATTNISTNPPYVLTFTSLFAGTVVNSTEKIWVSLDTNAESGASIYMASGNSGLKSTAANYTIASATADLAAASNGYGAQDLTVTQTTGGPLTTVSPYAGSGQNVGLLSSTLRQILTAAVPITGGRASVQIKAKASNQTPSANDYADSLTLITSGIF